MSDDSDWSDAPEGERLEDDQNYWVIGASDRVWAKHKYFPEQWHRSSIAASLVRTDATPVAFDLHPLVPGQTAIDWADKLLRDPEVAGWTEARIYKSPPNPDGRRGVVVARVGEQILSRGSRVDAWKKNDDFAPVDEPRTALPSSPKTRKKP